MNISKINKEKATLTTISIVIGQMTAIPISMPQFPAYSTTKRRCKASCLLAYLLTSLVIVLIFVDFLPIDELLEQLGEILSRNQRFARSDDKRAP